MDLLRESRYIISSFIIIIVCWLGWLCDLVFGQAVEAFTGAVNFPDVALTCLANLAVFFKFILRGKDFHETDVKDTLFHNRDVEERNINRLKVMTTCGENLENCSVVMLSFHYPATSGERKFMISISNASDVHSIFLRCRPLQCGAFTEDFRNTEDLREFRKCSCTENRDGRCGCIVFNTGEDIITLMLARQIPGTMKRLPRSQCLVLPSRCCLRNRCHDCHQGLLHVEDNRLRVNNSQAESPAAVCEILESIHKVSACICIPLLSADRDEWTNELIRVFEPQKGEFRGVVFREGGTNASSALENYKNSNEACDADETYSLASLAIVPQLAEALIMFVLTFLFKVDGFSSSMLAKRSVSSFSSGGRQIFPHEYLTRARVKSNANNTNANNTNVCQVFFFRPAFQISILHSSWYYSAGTCYVGWMVLLAMEPGAHTWYHIPFMAPSEGRIIVIIVAISIALAMDVFDLKLYLQIRRRPRFRETESLWKINFFHKSCRLTIDQVNILLFCAIIGLQLFLCISIGRVGGIKAFGKWIYIALQCLILAKWVSAVEILDNCQHALSQDSQDGKPMWWYGTCGHYMAASAFLLNATLAGVRAKWKFS